MVHIMGKIGYVKKLRLLKTRGGMHFNNFVYRKMIRPATMKSKTDNLWG